MDAGWFRSQFSPSGFAFMMGVRATQKWHLVEHVLLEPFKPEIDDWRDKQRNELGENQTSHDD